MQPEEKQIDEMRTLTVDVVLDMRRRYLQTTGCSVLKHWAQIQNRMRIATRTSATPQEWFTRFCDSLHLPCADIPASLAFSRLSEYVEGRKLCSKWLDLIEEEYGAIMAMARLAVEKEEEKIEKRKGDSHGKKKV